MLVAVASAVVIVIGLMVSIRSSAAGEEPRVTWRRILVIVAAVAGTFISLTLSKLHYAGDVVDVNTASQEFVFSPMNSSNIVWVVVSGVVTLILWGVAISQMNSIPPVAEGLVGQNKELTETEASIKESMQEDKK